VGQEPGRGGGLLRILFWGTPWFALPSLRALEEEGHEVVGVVTQPDRPAGRGRKLTPSPIKTVAMEEEYPLLAPEKPQGDHFLGQIRELEPDLSVVVAYGHILKPEVLAVPPRGSVNVHASLLPELRGAAPINWAILRGCEITGVTIMRMVEGMDAGPILYQVAEEIGPTETASELGGRLSGVGAEVLVEVLALMEAGVAEEVEQDHSRATFAPKVSREMARIDWSRPAVELDWHLRGLDAAPGAWSTLRGQEVKLFRPLPEPDFSHESPPGTVLEADPKGGLVVACGSGALAVGEIQSSGRKRMRTGDWLRGRSLPRGLRFE
jgi:methionyl-tRNA formyltransferase